ncbi:MAG: hypothetical protein M3N93_04160, partial [Acidobacteriota bacterium]|nr:hypothetical protein [Acidobacteriota bacterium]
MFLAISSIFSGTASAQSLNDATLSGRYFLRHIQFSANYLDSVTDARSITGVITFDGSGNYSFTGRQVLGQQPASSYSVNGTYSVTPAGYVLLTNPQNSSLTIGARYGTEAVIGASLTSAPNQFTDLFIAIPAPAITGPALTNQTLGAGFHIADFELTNADTSQVRVAAGSAQFDGSGNIQSFTALGRAVPVSAGATQQQAAYAGTYSVNSDGAGAIAFQVPANLSTQNALISGGSRTLMVSASQNIFIASTPGAHDILLGIKNTAGGNVAFTGRLWSASLATSGPGVVAGFSVYGNSASTLSSMAVDPAASTVIEAQAPNYNGVACFASAVGYSAATGSVLGANVLALGATTLLLGGNGLALEVNLGTNLATGQAAPGQFMLGLIETMPTLSGPGVFVNPQGVVNAASNTPIGCPIAPGEFISIYGSGLAAGSAAATALPFPLSLNGVSVTINDTVAPIYSVSPGQINCIVPYALTGPTATIVVTSNKAVSNAVTVSADTTSPGVFSVNGSGFGEGAITHANGTLVSAASPAQPGETV